MSRGGGCAGFFCNWRMEGCREVDELRGYGEWWRVKYVFNFLKIFFLLFFWVRGCGRKSP